MHLKIINNFVVLNFILLLIISSCVDLSNNSKVNSYHFKYELPKETINIISDSIIGKNNISYITVSSNIDINEVFFAFHYSQKKNDIFKINKLTNRFLVIDSLEIPVFSDEEVVFIKEIGEGIESSGEFKYCYLITDFRGNVKRMFCY
jgi:hypothetical protein